MDQSRAAWWVPAVGACVLAYLGLTTYADVFGPGAVGARLRFRGGRVRVLQMLDEALGSTIHATR